MARRKQATEKTRHMDTPAWITAADLYDGEWGVTSKLQIKAMTRPEINDLKTRVLGVLLIHSFGFEAELGVVMRQLKRAEVFETSPALVRKYPANKNGSIPVTEVMTSDSVATKLVEYALDGYEESGFALSPQRLQDLKKERQQVRHLLETLEAEGRIERARLNCLAQTLEGLGYEQAVDRGLLTPLRTMIGPDGKPSLERKRLGARRGAVVGIFLLARPKPAKTYGQRISVDKICLLNHSKSNNLNVAPLQESFDFMKTPDMRKLVAKASSTAPDQVKKALQAYKDGIDRLNLQLRDFLVIIAGEQPATNTRQEPDTRQESLFRPEPVPSSAPLNPPVEELPETSSAVDTTDRRAPIGRGADPSLVSQPRGTQPTYSHEAHQLLDVLLPFGIAADLEGCAAIIARCRESQPKCTIAGICAEAQALVPIARKKDDAFAWLIWKLPKQVADDPDREVERMAPGYSGLRPAAEPEAAVLDTTPEPEEAAQLKEQISKLRLAIKNAGKDLRDAGTSSIAIGRAKAKLGRLKADEEDLQTKLGKLLNPVANRPVQSEQAGLRPAEAAHGD